jgi:hypothetical protein
MEQEEEGRNKYYKINIIGLLKVKSKKLNIILKPKY